MARKFCLLKNKDLISKALALKEALFEDFAENLLKKCESCAHGIEKSITDKIHHKLITVYNELSDLKTILAKELPKVRE